MLENLTDYIYIVVAALFAIILHEIAHGLVSTWQVTQLQKDKEDYH